MKENNDKSSWSPACTFLVLLMVVWGAVIIDFSVKDHPFPPYAIICNSDGVFGYTDENGKPSDDTCPSREDANKVLKSYKDFRERMDLLPKPLPTPQIKWHVCKMDKDYVPWKPPAIDDNFEKRTDIVKGEMVDARKLNWFTVDNVFKFTITNPTEYNVYGNTLTFHCDYEPIVTKQKGGWKITFKEKK